MANVSLDWMMVTWGHRHVSKLVELILKIYAFCCMKSKCKVSGNWGAHTLNKGCSGELSLIASLQNVGPVLLHFQEIQKLRFFQ